jgi:hypothetical protein
VLRRGEMMNHKPIRNELGWSGVPPPTSITIDSDRKPVLYLPDGKALVRVIGFATKSDSKDEKL